jgi:transcription initiation factor IIE alpha subunit
MFRKKYDQDFVDVVHHLNKKYKGDRDQIAEEMGVKRRTIRYIINKRKPSKLSGAKLVSKVDKFLQPDAVVESFHEQDSKLTIWKRIKKLLGIFYKKK